MTSIHVPTAPETVDVVSATALSIFCSANPGALNDRAVAVAAKQGFSRAFDPSPSVDVSVLLPSPRATPTPPNAHRPLATPPRRGLTPRGSTFAASPPPRPSPSGADLSTSLDAEADAEAFHRVGAELTATSAPPARVAPDARNAAVAAAATAAVAGAYAQASARVSTAATLFPRITAALHGPGPAPDIARLTLNHAIAYAADIANAIYGFRLLSASAQIHVLAAGPASSHLASALATPESFDTSAARAIASGMIAVPTSPLGSAMRFVPAGYIALQLALHLFTPNVRAIGDAFCSRCESFARLAGLLRPSLPRR